jgi:hypothetical protein
MEDYTRIIVPLILAATAGCTQIGDTYQRIAGYMDKTEDRTPGEKMKRSAEEVAEGDECTSVDFRQVRLVVSEISPDQVSPGGRISHRLAYTACPQAVGPSMQGTLLTTISYGYKKILRDSVRGFEIKPGEWIVDTDIVIPPTAKLGGYVLEVEFRSVGVSLHESTPFTVTLPNNHALE